MSDAAERIPVIAGTGQVNDRANALDSLGLMLAAAQAADADAGGELLARTDWLGVVAQISFPEYRGKLVEGISAGLGVAPAIARETPLPTGDSPMLLLNEAANAIGEGRAQVALIAGGEGLRAASRRAAEAGRGPYPPRTPSRIEARHRYGLITPADVYPLFENAVRAAWGQSFDAAQAESAAIWAGMSRIAAANPDAWLRTERTAGEIATAGADNRPIAFPYTKLMVANAAVNQGAALIVTSLAAARAVGIAEDRLIYVGRGAAAHEDDDPLMRPDFAASASMAVSLQRALALNGLAIGDIDHLELYSCFPCVPKMARRILDIPVETPITAFGGLTFGGGPIGNYMTHAAASMVAALRRGGTNGLLFANGGYATHNHSLVLSRRPPPAGTLPHDFDFQAEADASRGPSPPLDEGYSGPAAVETYTVLYDRAGEARFGVVIARAPDGRRAIARVPADDAAAIAFLTSGESEPVGAPGSIARDGELNRWRFA